MWNLNDGKEMGLPLLLPAQSIWPVACLNNGDIDAERIFLFLDALLTRGRRQGQNDGSVICYNWTLGKWNLVGDVIGASGGRKINSGKILHQRKEYDYVFDVDILETTPVLKLPYNRGEDPSVSAQAFIHRHNLPQDYLHQVVNFIIKNSSSHTASAPSSSYGNRYVPGLINNELLSYGNLDLFAGDGEKHFPLSTYLTFDAYDPIKILNKLKEFNQKLPYTVERITESVLTSLLKLPEYSANADPTAIEGLKLIELLFSVFDICRLALRTESILIILKSWDFMDLILPHLSTSAAT
uniref:PFU domain-containing protein n=1 Tax=Glossina brevipalpis TaxID=37001 RepID=A0A1A9WIT6_9MUSC